METKKHAWERSDIKKNNFLKTKFQITQNSIYGRRGITSMFILKKGNVKKNGKFGGRLSEVLQSTHSLLTK